MNILTLEKLPNGTTARILNIEESCNCRLRLMDLGFTADTEVSPVLQGFAGGITAYRIKGTLIALRSKDAGCVNVFINTGEQDETSS